MLAPNARPIRRLRVTKKNTGAVQHLGRESDITSRNVGGEATPNNGHLHPKQRCPARRPVDVSLLIKADKRINRP